jgi:hypothetical protein
MGTARGRVGGVKKQSGRGTVRRRGVALAVCAVVGAAAGGARADEQLFGYVKGAEPLPKEAWEIYESLTLRTDKGRGHYEALNAETEIEYGATDRLTLSAALAFQSIDTSGLVIDGYLPKDEQYGLRASGVEARAKYNIMSAAKDGLGVSLAFGLDYDWLDAHSGQDKDKLSFETDLLLQKYFQDGQLIWVGNAGLEATHATRGEIDDLPEDFEWTTDPEIELEVKLGTGLSYRFAPRWFVGGEALYETEYETEVGQERWSIFAGPSLHYGSQRWWVTLTWLPQIRGGGEQYPGQEDRDLHLIEKTKQEVRLKAGLNF